MCFKILTIFVIYSVLVASNADECSLKFDDDVPINMTSINILGYIFKTAEENSSGFMKAVLSTGPISFDSLIPTADCDVNKYFKNAGANGETVRIVATKDLNQFNDDTESTTGDCPFKIRFKTEGCDEFGDAATTDVDFFIHVEDVNLLPPKFGSSEYNLTVTFPMGIDAIVNEGTDIFATDNDFSTSFLWFLIRDNEGWRMFKIEPLPADHLKRFGILLRPTFEHGILRDMSFVIEVQDNGPGYGNTTVNIIVDKMNSEAPQPEFTQSLYEGSFNQSEVTINKYVLLEPIIALKDDFGAFDELTVQLSTNPYFIVKRDNYSVRFRLIVVKEIDVFNEPIFVDVVVTIVDKVATTKVSITVISDDVPAPPPTGGGGGKKDHSYHTGLFVSMIVLALLTTCLLGAFAYIFWNYTITKKVPKTGQKLTPHQSH